VVAGRRDTSRRTSPRNQEDGVRGHGWELDRTSLAARFAFSLSGTTAPRIPCARLNPSTEEEEEEEETGGRRPRGWGGTAPWLAFALSDLIRGQILDSAVWATEGPEEQGQAESAAVRTRGVRGRCLGPTAAGRRVRGGRIRWADAEVAVQVGAERGWIWPGLAGFLFLLFSQSSDKTQFSSRVCYSQAENQ